MAGSTYSVNLKLDTAGVEKKLATLKKQVDTFRKTLATPIKVESKAQQLAEKRRKIEDRRGAQMARNRGLGDQIRKLEEKGLKLDKAKERIAKAADATNKKKFETARTNLKFASDEVKQAQKLLVIKQKTQKFNSITRSDVLGVSASPVNLKIEQQRRRFKYTEEMKRLELRGIDVGPMHAQIGKMTDAQNRPIRAHRGLGGKVESVDSKGRAVGAMLGRGITDLNMLKAANAEMERLLRAAREKLKLERASEVALRKQNKALRDSTSMPGLTKAQLSSYGPQPLSKTGWASSPIAGGRNMKGSPLNKQMWAGVGKSALISGGFPLLFGQGPGTALAGGIGGAVGERLSKGGGFAGGIAATAAVTAISQATKAVIDLGQAMGPFAEDAAAVAVATGNSNTLRGVQLQTIEKLYGKQAAYNAAMKDMEKLVGKSGVKALKQFGSDTQRLANDWARFMTQMSSGFAKLLNWSGLFAEGTKSKVERAKAGSFAAGGYDDAALDALVAKLAEAQSMPGTGASGNRIRGREVRKAKWAIEARVDELDKDPKYSDKNRLDAQNKLNDSLDRTLKLYKSIGDTIKSGLVDGITAAIEGTKSLGEVAGNVLRNIGRMILQYGVNSLFASIMPNNPKWQKIFGFADGGRPPTGRPSVVGERGPELFVPDSAGTIVPNHDLGGSMVVNVDASGSSVDGDADRSRQLGELIGAAVQSELIRQQRPGGTLYA